MRRPRATGRLSHGGCDCGAAASGRSLADYIDFARAGLANAAAALAARHAAVVLATGELSACATPAQAALLFTPGCLRAGGAACVPASHPFHRATTSGLDALIIYFVETAALLANETVAALAAGSAAPGSAAAGIAAVATTSRVAAGVRNARADFLWSSAEADAADGAAASTAAFQADAKERAAAAGAAAGAIFAAFLVTAAAAYAGVFRPFVLLFALEFTRASSLLRSLPPGISLVADDAGEAAAA